MIPKPDAQSYTRFLMTVGLLLCGLAFVGPALVIRETDVLRISSKELAELTPLARKELTRRQGVSRDIAVASPYAAGALFALGLLLMGLAIPRLRQQEHVSDALSEDELRRRLEHQDPTEREAEIERDVREQVAEARQPLEHPEAAPTSVDEQETSRSDQRPKGQAGSPAGDEPADRESGANTDAAVDANVAAIRQKLRGAELFVKRTRALEDRVLAYLTRTTPPIFSVHTQVRLTGATDLTMDGLLLAQSDRLRDVVVEVQVYAVLGVVPDTRRALRRAAITRERYGAQTGRSAIAWLIVVNAEELTQQLFPLDDQDGDTLVTVVAPDAIETLDLPRVLRAAGVQME